MWDARRSKGFTLIEVMVAVIIIAIVSGLGILWVGQIQKNMFKKKIEEIAVYIKYASIRSLISGDKVNIIIPFNCTEVIIQTDKLLRRVELPQGTKCYIYREGNRLPIEGPLFFTSSGGVSSFPTISFTWKNFSSSINSTRLSPFKEVSP